MQQICFVRALDADSSVKLLLYAVATSMRPDEFKELPRHELLSLTGLSPNTLESAIKRAEKTGWLKVVRKPGYANRYRITILEQLQSRGQNE